MVCEDTMQPEIVHQEKATCPDDALSGHVALTHSALRQWANHNLEATSIFRSGFTHFGNGIHQEIMTKEHLRIKMTDTWLELWEYIKM